MIEVRDLGFAYRGGREMAVRDLTFRVGDGEVFGFLGPSGAGKTTTFNVLLGVLRGFEGQATVMGRDVRSISPDYYEEIGVAFETANLYTKFTALENLEFFRSLYRGPTALPGELLALVHLEEYAKTRVSAFSKGMKMRLRLCRALINRPRLLFLDEPTSGLDPVNSRRVRSIISEQKRQGTTIFLTTHDMAVAADVSDRVAFIVDGQIRLIDSPRRLGLSRGRKTVAVEYREGDRLATAEFALKGIGSNERFLSIIKKPTFPKLR